MTDMDVTPIRHQYLEIKKQHPDAILFFRLGDFYETFDHDAEITSRELDIVLTSRAVAKGNRVPMAGIPYHAVENYLSRLIQKGFHVAICEQVGDQPIKGLFPREVVRVVTPGTLVEPSLLKADQNNYLVSIFIQENKCGIAYADISTGEFSCTELEGTDLLNLIRTEISRLNPAEILISEKQLDNFLTSYHLTKIPAWHFDLIRCQKILSQHFSVVTLDGFGLRDLELATRAAGSLMQYLQSTQSSALNLLVSLKTYHTNDFMIVDDVTRRNLELTETIRNGKREGSLLSIIDHTVTPMGHRLIAQWLSKPLLEINLIENRLEKVEALYQNGVLRSELIQALRQICDIERITNRILAGLSIPRELVALRETLLVLPHIKNLIGGSISCFSSMSSELRTFENELDLLNRSITDSPPLTTQNTGIIRPGYSEELDNLIDTSKHAREWIANLESVERERTGIKNLKVGFNKVFGYYIEVTHSNTESIPSNYIRKQTLVNAERYITPEMKEYESLVLNAEERIHDLEVRLFHEVCRILSQSSQLFIQTSRLIGELDTLLSFAETAALGAYHRPEIISEPILEIVDGRHPTVEKMLIGERFIPNDAIFEPGEVIRVITGPNMSGKSTFLRQVALISLLAQIGCFVPATSARIGLVDRIFTRIGAQDEIHGGQSTFMVEMSETANILNHATSRSLLILDEIGRGTSTYDGLSIAWSVIEYIHNHPKLQSRTLFATHYHELTQLSELLPGVRNYNVAVSESEGKVIFLHKIIPGGTDRSYGIHVAQLAGLPSTLIQRATEILHLLEASAGSVVNLNAPVAQQMTFFPETNPLIAELYNLDINTLSPIEALNKLYEWQRRFTPPDKSL